MLFGDIEKLLIDATESPRPSNNEEQYYSGKKNIRSC
jgi:hypothetical protein